MTKLGQTCSEVTLLEYSMFFYTNTWSLYLISIHKIEIINKNRATILVIF